MTRPGETLAIELAGARDVPVIRLMVEAAYRKYVGRIGQRPAPMTADHETLVQRCEVHVLRAGGDVVGAVVLSRKADAMQVDNLVVAPAVQGRGYGRMLMHHAERMARAESMRALTLFTNQAMHENIALYRRYGFVETGRRREEGFDRVFFRKSLA